MLRGFWNTDWLAVLCLPWRSVHRPMRSGLRFWNRCRGTLDIGGYRSVENIPLAGNVTWLEIPATIAMAAPTVSDSTHQSRSLLPRAERMVNPFRCAQITLRANECSDCRSAGPSVRLRRQGSVEPSRAVAGVAGAVAIFEPARARQATRQSKKWSGRWSRSLLPRFADAGSHAAGNDEMSGANALASSIGKGINNTLAGRLYVGGGPSAAWRRAEGHGQACDGDWRFWRRGLRSG